MKSRICPNCNIKLGIYDNHFCSSCGSSLPNDVVVYSAPFRIKIHKPSENLHHRQRFTIPKVDFKSKNMKLAMIGVLVLCFGVIGYTTIPLVNHYIYGDESLDMQHQSQIPLRTLELNLPLGVDNFGGDKLDEIVPGTARVFIELNDISGFMEEYIVSDKIDAAADLFIKYGLNEHVVIFSTETGDIVDWTIVTIPIDKSVASELISEIDESYWEFKYIDDFLVVSTNEEIFDQIEATKNGFSTSLALNPEYSRENSTLPAKGKVQVMFLGDNSKEHLNTLDLSKFSEEFEDIFNQVLAVEYSSLVIN